jgi:acyl-CoA thioester hydrolase
MKIRVYYEDTDLGGIVYHANYLKYCERARSEMFFERGISPLMENGGGFVVRNMNADFLATATLGDSLLVTSTLQTLKSTSLRLLQEVWKEEKKIFSMEILLVYIEQGKPVRIPKVFKALF